MTALAKGNLVVRGVAAYLPALQMVDVKPDFLLFAWMSSASLASVVVSPKHVLPYIVVTIHLALLVILTLRNGLSIRNGFQQLQVELGGFYDHLADGQDTTDAPDGSDMLLDFTSSEGASQPLCLLRTRLSNRGLRYRVLRFLRALRNSRRVDSKSTTSFRGFTSAESSSSFVVDTDIPMVLLPASTPKMTSWV